MHHHFQKTPRQPLRASYHADSARALTLDSKVLGRITALPIRTCRIVPGVGRHELDRVPSAPGMELTERGWLDRSHRSDPAPFWLLGAWESHVVYVGAKGDLHLTSTPRANMYRFLIQLSLSQVHSRGSRGDGTSPLGEEDRQCERDSWAASPLSPFCLPYTPATEMGGDTAPEVGGICNVRHILFVRNWPAGSTCGNPCHPLHCLFTSPHNPPGII